MIHKPRGKPASGVEIAEHREELDHLFEAHQQTTQSWRKYLRVFGVVAAVVIIAGAVVAYLTLPGIGDAVRAPAGLENAVRDHMLSAEKRIATDITFYYCDTYYWARVGVEKRPDIKTNPIYLIDRYNARAAAASDGQWSITAAPAISPEDDIPCK